ncbi:MAG: transketolase family protein [Clostridia bacterium]|nr:transketolase family protein [Clostridia bacterium]
MSKTLAPREAFGKALVQLGAENEDILVLDADCSKATMTSLFQKEFPHRFFNLGIAEADLVGTGAGLALAGKTPFVNAYANFLTGRAWDQIRISVCYANLNVKVIGHNSGTSPGQEGPTHLPLEDITLMRALPRMTVIEPADGVEMAKAVRALGEHEGPAYLRVGRMPTPIVNREAGRFVIGKANVYLEGKDASILACGVMLSKALEAAEELKAEGISVDVINVHTIKPLDSSCILEAASRTGAVVTAEEHTVIGGLGGAVAELLAQNLPVPVRMVGVQDRFGLSAKMPELHEALGLTRENIIKAVKEVISAKK